MRWEAVTTGFYLEGLAIEDNGDIWFSDVVKGGLHRLAANGERQSWLHDKKFIAALALNHDGSVIFTGAHGIGWLDPESGATGSVLDTIEDAPVPGVNELAMDGEGGVFFGTIDLVSVAKGGRPGPSALYHLHADGKLVQLVGGLKFSNGLGVSPDFRRLYHNETFVATFGYDLANDALGAPTKLRDKQDGDGMAIDAEGGVWISGCRSNTLTRLTPDGGQESFDLPGEACTNVRFGGVDGETMYVNIVTLDAVNALATGGMIQAETSTMYRAAAPVRGLPQHHTRFALRTSP